jgi:hypothetical protein
MDEPTNGIFVERPHRVIRRTIGKNPRLPTHFSIEFGAKSLPECVHMGSQGNASTVWTRRIRITMRAAIAAASRSWPTDIETPSALRTDKEALPLIGENFNDVVGIEHPQLDQNLSQSRRASPSRSAASLRLPTKTRSDLLGSRFAQPHRQLTERRLSDG